MFPLSGKNDYMNVIKYKRININPQTEPPANTDKKTGMYNRGEKKLKYYFGCISLSCNEQRAYARHSSKITSSQLTVLSPHKITWHCHILAEI